MGHEHVLNDPSLKTIQVSCWVKGTWPMAGSRCPWTPRMDLTYLPNLKGYVGAAYTVHISGCAGIKRVQLWIGPFTSETPGIVGIQVHVTCWTGPHLLD